ncbi:hypothetical protein ACFOWE_30850 [Planomonospora corallina]|uniref:Two-component sensor histidine kinase n=1 Tax=Planomonospora corallina TaxID=1806052 RepID=A0ABV8IER7_9ACTN
MSPPARSGEGGAGGRAAAASGRGGRRLGGLSLRSRLLLITTALLAVGLLVSGAVALATLRSHLVGRVDERLKPAAALLARLPPALLQPSPGADPQVPRVLPDMDVIGRIHIAYLGPDGTVLRHRSVPAPSPDGGPRLPPLDAGTVARLAGRPFEVPGQPGTADWRVVVMPREEGPPSPDQALPADGGVVVARRWTA